MISHIRGILHSRDEDRVVVDVGGIGYEVIVPPFVREAYKDVREGDPIEFVTYYHVAERQPRPILIGFKRAVERDFFEKFLTVGNIGPIRGAAAMVRSISVLARAIEGHDLETLKQLPGIGERTAGKIIAALAGKVAKEAMMHDEGIEAVPTTHADLRAETVDALVSIGYKRPEARQLVDEALKRNPSAASADELIQEIFRAERH